MFKKLFRSVTSILLAGMLCACTACSQEEETGTGFHFTTVLAGNPECLDPQYTRNENANIVISNIMEGLLRLDENGVPVEAGAESFTVSDDGLYYMFNLRDNSFWYHSSMDEDDAIPVTAQDYVYAFRRLLDPVTQSPHAADFACLKNAAAVMAGSMGTESLGVSAPDAETVMFELEYTNAEFLSLLTQPCTVPCNEAFFRSTNGRYGLDMDTVLCNGSFYLTKWNYDAYSDENFLSFRPNPTYHDAENTAPNGLTYTIMKSRTAADNAFADGDADILLTNSYHAQYAQSDDYTVKSERAITLGLIFNPNSENAVIQQEKFRLALAYGINRTAYAPVTGTDLEAAYGIIPPAVNLLGSPYREQYADETLALPYDPQKSAALFRQVMDDLQMNSMNTIRIMVSNEITDTDALLTICQEWQTLFGQYIGIETVTPTEYESRLASGEYTIALYGIQADRSSCYEVLRQFVEQKKLLGFESAGFNGIMAQLASTSRLADAVPLYGAAEQAILETNTFIPLFYKNSYLICTAGNEDIAFDAFAGTADFRYAKHFSE